MRYPSDPRRGRGERATVCVSSQAGCAVGCPFCATGELGFTRNLTAGEIQDQVRIARQLLRTEGRELTNVVFMGMGEPLQNADAVLAAIDSLVDPKRGAMGQRRIVVSTSGVVPGIARLASERPQVTLAVSLHAARNPLRDLLVPLNRKWPVEEVIAAATAHHRTTGRRTTYEVTLIDGINDTDEDVRELVRVLGRQPAKRASAILGRLVARLWTLRQMSVAVAGMMQGGKSPAIEASLVKDLGTIYQQDLPEIARTLAESAAAGRTFAISSRTVGRRSRG